ncbi:hypothetical protein Hanom_Chr01g00048561 [Helianthus anomalus]
MSRHRKPPNLGIFVDLTETQKHSLVEVGQEWGCLKPIRSNLLFRGLNVYVD